MAAAMGRITLSHLMDRNLYPFTTLQATGLADPLGDKAFDDDDPCAEPKNEQPLRMLRDRPA